MKLYNIRLPEELSYALKQAGADHVRQTLASSYGIDCKTDRAKPVPPERKTTKERKTKEVSSERKTTDVVINKRKTDITPEKLRVIADEVATTPMPEVDLDPFKDLQDHLMSDTAFEAVEAPKEVVPDPSGPIPAWKAKLEADRVRLAEEAKKPKPKEFTGITQQA
jgi:hypothetical protein